MWHLDFDEKLSPWGFHISGCVDGHSRFILWDDLITNKSPITGTNVFIF